LQPLLYRLTSERKWTPPMVVFTGSITSPKKISTIL
jgi:hypothetical protein